MKCLRFWKTHNFQTIKDIYFKSILKIWFNIVSKFHVSIFNTFRDVSSKRASGLGRAGFVSSPFLYITSCFCASNTSYCIICFYFLNLNQTNTSFTCWKCERIIVDFCSKIILAKLGRCPIMLHIYIYIYTHV